MLSQISKLINCKLLHPTAKHLLKTEMSYFLQKQCMFTVKNVLIDKNTQ